MPVRILQLVANMSHFHAEQLLSSGIAGVTPTLLNDVKCLHAQLADHLCRGGNTVTDEDESTAGLVMTAGDLQGGVDTAAAGGVIADVAQSAATVGADCEAEAAVNGSMPAAVSVSTAAPSSAAAAAETEQEGTLIGQAVLEGLRQRGVSVSGCADCWQQVCAVMCGSCQHNAWSHCIRGRHGMQAISVVLRY